MIQLTEEQKEELERHSLSESDVFDATGLSKKEYRPIMKNLDKLVAIGVTPCQKEGHTMRTRSGHCLACNRQSMTQLRRYYENAFVYIAVSNQNQKTKIGYATDVNERGVSLNGSRYGGASDWEIVYSVKCKNAGKIETEVHKKLADYLSPSDYKMGGKVVASYEMFSCGYKKAKEVLEEVKKELSDQFLGEEKELDNAEEEFSFVDVKTSIPRTIGNSGEEVDHKKINYPSERKNEFEEKEDFNHEEKSIKVKVIKEGTTPEAEEKFIEEAEAPKMAPVIKPRSQGCFTLVLIIVFGGMVLSFLF